MAGFTAQFDSDCPACGDVIEAGEQITGSTDGFVHVECAPQPGDDDYDPLES